MFSIINWLLASKQVFWKTSWFFQCSLTFVIDFLNATEHKTISQCGFFKKRWLMPSSKEKGHTHYHHLWFRTEAFLVMKLVKEMSRILDPTSIWSSYQKKHTHLSFLATWDCRRKSASTSTKKKANKSLPRKRSLLLYLLDMNKSP